MSKLVVFKGLVSAPGDDARLSFAPVALPSSATCWPTDVSVGQDAVHTDCWHTHGSDNITPLNYCCSNKHKCRPATYLLLFIGPHKAVINCCNSTFNSKPSIIKVSWPTVCKFHKPDSPLQYPSTWYANFQQKYLQQGNELHCIKRRLYKLQPTCRLLHDQPVPCYISQTPNHFGLNMLELRGHELNCNATAKFSRPQNIVT